MKTDPHQDRAKFIDVIPIHLKFFIDTSMNLLIKVLKVESASLRILATSNSPEKVGCTGNFFRNSGMTQRKTHFYKRSIFNCCLSDKGFTFIELIMVVTIIGILAVVNVPNFKLSPYYGNIYINEGLILSESVRKKIIDFYDFTGKFPIDNETLGLPAPEAIRGKYTESITVKNGAIDIRLNQDVSMGFAGLILTIRPAIPKADPTGAIVWIKGKDAVPPGLKVIGTDKTTIHLP